MTIRYLGAAFALKLFSCSPQTKRIYRFLGNTIGARNRLKIGLPASYVHRSKWFLRLFQKYDFMQEGSRLLELGTGWVHWDSTFLRLFYDANITLFDVWDNRQLQPFKKYFSEFHNVFEKEIYIPPPRRDRVEKLLDAIAAVNSFDELYHLLGFEYVIEPTGKLHNFKDEFFDACFSYNVLEHVDKKIVSGYIRDLYRLLKGGGYSLHVIDISDHLSNYDLGVCRKHYLRYSDPVWMLCFENEVQYFNRVQRVEWLKLLREAGFDLLEEEPVFQPIRTRVNERYKTLDTKDIECTTLRIVHRKPL